MTDKPKALIIGGGIFGLSAAIELARFCDVTVFEQTSDIMMGGTYGNQYRHHLGYHYPRSKETVAQCLAAQDDFFSVWGGAVIGGFPAYYAVAKEGSKVSADAFLSFCKEMGLPRDIAYPEEEFLNRTVVDICIKTGESVYDLLKLRSIAREKMQTRGVALRLHHRVVGGRRGEGGEKFLLVTDGHKSFEERGDIIVNAMYANHNLFLQWFGFSHPPLEFRLKELPVVRLPTQTRVSVTIMDGPFLTLVPMAEISVFTLGDVPRSICEIRFSDGGIPWTKEEIESRTSRFHEMKEANPFYIPIIAKAHRLHSMFTILPILPNSDVTDERLTAVTSHGEGLWSVFEGKIVTCVRAAKEVMEQALAWAGVAWAG